VVVAVSAPKITRLPSRLDGADILFCTRDEARAWLAAHGEARSQDTDVDLVARLCAAGARRVVLTRGAEGAIAGVAGQAAWEIPSEPVAVVDVTGGGDALVAGTITALAEGRDFESAVRRGVRLAGLTVAAPGAVRADLAADPVADLAADLAADPTRPEGT
jgi:sugar/nucleoside kinase (ribokinase family)